MAGSAIRIAVLANASQAKRELASVETSGQRFSRAIGNASKVAAVGLLAVGAAAVKAGRAAAQDEAGAARLAKTLRTAAHATDGQVASTETWITAQGKALGVADDELRPALARLAVATGSVSKAQKLASLAMDVSAGTGKSLEAVSSALAKAQNGNVGALGRLGIATKDASGKTKTLTQITADLAAKFRGDASAAAVTTAGKQRILTVQLNELQETIGAKLLPAMVALTNAGLASINWATRHGTVAKVLLITFVSLAAATVAISAAMKVAAAAQAVYTVAMAASAAVQGAFAGAAIGTRIALAGLAVTTAVVRGAVIAWTAAQWLLNVALTANPIGIIVVAIAAFVAAIVIAYKKSAAFRAVCQAAFPAIALAVRQLGAVATWLWTHAFQPAFKFIVKGIAYLMLMWAKMLGALSHVPGFGWAKKAADGMYKAAGRANELANNIGKVHSKNVKVTADTRQAIAAANAATAAFHNLFGYNGRTVHVTAEQRRKYTGNSGIGGQDPGRTAADAFASGRVAGGGTVTVKLTAEQVSQVQRGKEIALDIDAYRRAGGRV